MKKCFPIRDIGELHILALALKDACRKEGPLPVFMDGDLGVGKTTFVRYVVESLEGGKGAEVNSPSFNIYNVYPTIPEVVHVDLYRIYEVPEEVFALFEEEDIWIFMEWCNKLDASLWPEELLYLQIDMKKGGDRVFTFSGIGKSGERFLSLISKRFRS